MSFELPLLNYNTNSLEPHIDTRTMEIHHGKHHAGYTNNLNNAIKGTNLENSKIMTSGGRVLGVTAKGKTLEIAKNRAYDVLKKIEFNGAQFRTDIGKKALT